MEKYADAFDALASASVDVIGSLVRGGGNQRHAGTAGLDDVTLLESPPQEVSVCVPCVPCVPCVCKRPFPGVFCVLLVRNSIFFFLQLRVIGVRATPCPCLARIEWRRHTTGTPPPQESILEASHPDSAYRGPIERTLEPVRTDDSWQKKRGMAWAADRALDARDLASSGIIIFFFFCPVCVGCVQASAEKGVPVWISRVCVRARVCLCLCMCLCLCICAFVSVCDCTAMPCRFNGDAGPFAMQGVGARAGKRRWTPATW